MEVPLSINLPIEVAFTLAVDLRPGSLHDLQRDMRRESRGALLRALGVAIGRVEKALVAQPVRCPQCARSMRSRGRTSRRLVTVFGTLTVERARYRCSGCRLTRRPLDEWIGPLAGSEYTALVVEQALYLAADLSYERAAEVLRHVGGVGISGRQIQRLLNAENEYLRLALGKQSGELEGAPRRRFRRAGKVGTTEGAERLLQLRRLRTSGQWNEYWARRFQPERAAPLRADAPSRKLEQAS